MNDVDSSLAALVTAALRDGNIDEVSRVLRRQEFPNSFAILAAVDVIDALKREQADRTISEWITRRVTWDVALLSSDTRLSPGEKLLFELWGDLEGRLRKRLEAVVRRVPLAPSGAVICFFGGATLSIIVGYNRTEHGIFVLKPIAIDDRPRGVFEIEHLFAKATPAQRNAIKASALSVDKMIFQRGVLTHVDRQRDNVFGPSIDTIVMAEILLNTLQTHGAPRELTALEIGAGSGHLCVSLANAGAGRIYAVDLKASAVVCTLKNLLINEFDVDAKQPQISVRAEPFRREEFAGQVDLLVCNPPYLPEDEADPDAERDAHGEKDAYDVAVRGVKLSVTLLEKLDSLLKPDGRLLLMTSSVSSDVIMEKIPIGFEATAIFPEPGLRVPLDVDVLWQREDWRQALIGAGRIKVEPDGTLWHDIQPLWIQRRQRA